MHGVSRMSTLNNLPHQLNTCPDAEPMISLWLYIISMLKYLCKGRKIKDIVKSRSESG